MWVPNLCAPSSSTPDRRTSPTVLSRYGPDTHPHSLAQLPPSSDPPRRPSSFFQYPRLKGAFAPPVGKALRGAQTDAPPGTLSVIEPHTPQTRGRESSPRLVRPPPPASATFLPVAPD